MRRTVRGATSVVGGLVWWWVALPLAAHPDAVASWQVAVAAGGWSLGLIPVHAVPSRIPEMVPDAVRVPLGVVPEEVPGAAPDSDLGSGLGQARDAPGTGPR